MIHNLKSYPEFFAATVSGAKTHEVRPLGDHLSVDSDSGPFEVGDTLVLHEFDPVAEAYSGRTCTVTVTWQSGPKPWLDPGYVVMSIRLQA